MTPRVRERGRVKYFQCPEPLLSEFEVFCKFHGLNQAEIISDLIAQYLKENETQQTLMAFPKKHDPAIAFFERARVYEARKELEWIADLLEKEPEKREETQLDLARALKIVEPIYMKTRDPELLKLLDRIQVALKR